MSDTLKKIYYVDDLELSPLANAYARARGADRMSSYGDFVALSDICDVQTAKMLHREVSDGVIAPGYTEEALAVLKTKRKGTYNIIEIDPNYVPELTESKQVFGITFEQDRNEAKITEALLENRPTVNKEIPESAARDFAAESHVDRSIENPAIFLETNIMGTAVLMDACRKYGIQRYHQVSMMSAAFFTRPQF